MAWHRSYLESILQRDVRDATRISALDVLPKLLQAAAVQTAGLFNVSALAAPFALSRTTIRDYLALLERIFLIERLPPWHSNRLSRLVKTPNPLRDSAWRLARRRRGHRRPRSLPLARSSRPSSSRDLPPGGWRERPIGMYHS
jgi:hypothetical protein